METDGLWTVRLLGIALLLATAALATSIGGAGIVASPVTLPLLFLVVHALRSRPFTAVAVLVGGITAAEACWAVAYLLGAPEGLAMAAAVVGAIATAVIFVKAGTPGQARSARTATP